MPKKEPILWPLIVLDFEASSVLPQSYPIEVGLAIWKGLGSSIETWSTLICPTKDWINNGTWIAEAQAIHGIAPHDLSSGMSASDTLDRLNDLVADSTAYVDGGTYDQYWMMRLAFAGGMDIIPQMGNWLDVVNALSDDEQSHLQQWLRDHAAPHRAGPDSVRLMRAYAYATTGQEPSVTTL